MTKPVAIVQHQPSVPPGLVADVLRSRGRPFTILEAWRDPVWPSIGDLSGVVVMGGTMNVDQLDDYPFLKSSRDLMAEAIDSGVPTLGVCLGSQMMARVLGADVVRADPRNALFSQLELTEEGRRDPLVMPFAETEVLQFHEDTFRAPEGATQLAVSGSSGLAQAFRFGTRAYAIQFHFEVDRGIVRGWLDNIGRQALLDEWGVDEGEFLRATDRFLPRQSRAGVELVESWMRLSPG